MLKTILMILNQKFYCDMITYVISNAFSTVIQLIQKTNVISYLLLLMLYHFTSTLMDFSNFSNWNKPFIISSMNYIITKHIELKSITV